MRSFLETEKMLDAKLFKCITSIRIDNKYEEDKGFILTEAISTYLNKQDESIGRQIKEYFNNHATIARQIPGDVVFVPSCSPHQVTNCGCSKKTAYNVMTPETISNFCKYIREPLSHWRNMKKEYSYCKEEEMYRIGDALV